MMANVFPKLQTVENFERPPCKERCIRTRFDSRPVKVSQILAKSPLEHFHHVFYHFEGS